MSDTQSLSDNSESPSDVCISFYTSADSAQTTSLPPRQLSTVLPGAYVDCTDPDTPVMNVLVLPGSDTVTNARGNDHSFATTAAEDTVVPPAPPISESEQDIRTPPLDIIRRIVDSGSTEQILYGSLESNPPELALFDEHPIVHLTSLSMDNEIKPSITPFDAPVQESTEFDLESNLTIQARTTTEKGLQGESTGSLNDESQPIAATELTGEAPVRDNEQGKCDVQRLLGLEVPIDTHLDQNTVSSQNEEKIPDALSAMGLGGSLATNESNLSTEESVTDTSPSFPGKIADKEACDVHRPEGITTFVEDTQEPPAPIHPEDLPSIPPISVELLVPPVAVNHHLNEALYETIGQVTVFQESEDDEFCRVTRGKNIVLMPDDTQAYRFLKIQQDQKKKRQKTGPQSPLTPTTPKRFPMPQFGTESSEKDVVKHAEQAIPHRIESAKRKAFEKKQIISKNEKSVPRRGGEMHASVRTEKKRKQSQILPVNRKSKVDGEKRKRR